MRHRTLPVQAGFTAIELLITLFVAGIFLLAGYQLFNTVMTDGGEARAESRASNIAYEYLRRYSNAATNPCTEQAPLTDEPLDITGLSAVTVSIALSCPQIDTPTLSKVESIVHYGNPIQTVRYATYVDASRGASASVDVTVGLVARYPFNGNANADVGGANGVIYGATPSANKDGVANMAYSFAAGSQQRIEIPSTFGLGTTYSSTTLWVYQASATGSGQYIKFGDTTSGFGLGIGSATYDNSAPGSKQVGLFEGVRWIDMGASSGAGWHFLCLVISNTGVPSLYRDGVLVGTYSGTNTIAPAGNITYVGGQAGLTRFVTGSIDDLRIYNRILTGSEITQLYTIGPK